jgi:Uma2 family endonuclease
MAVQLKRPITAVEFDEWVLLPENSDRRFEYIAGEIVEVVSNDIASEIAINIAAELRQFLKQNPLGRVTGADGGYIIAGHRYIPDVAFISYQRQAGPSGEAYNPTAPELAVEVVSPTDRIDKLMIKVGNYLAVGTRVWVVYPDTREVQDYAAGQAVQVLDENGTLDGGEVLPGFTLPVKDIFPTEREEQG